MSAHDVVEILCLYRFTEPVSKRKTAIGDLPYSEDMTTAHRLQMTTSVPGAGFRTACCGESFLVEAETDPQNPRTIVISRTIHGHINDSLTRFRSRGFVAKTKLKGLQTVLTAVKRLA